MLYLEKTILGLFVHGGLLFVAAAIALHKGYIDSWLPQLSALLSWATLGIGFLLGWRFHRSRLAFAVFALILTDRMLHYYGPGSAVSSGHETTILNVAAMLLPLNLVILYLGKDRGVMNLSGFVRACFLCSQPIIVYSLLKENPEIFNHLSHQFLSLQFLVRLKAPQAVMFLHTGVIATFLALALFRHQAVIRGFFWAFVSSGVGFYWFYNEAGQTIYFSLAGLVLILSVIEIAYVMAYHDELTGLPARRSLNTTLQNLGRQYTIAMLDIDFFKKFNDRHGHDVGDQVLCMVASHIKRVGGGGKPFRYGGEEFTIVFPGKSVKEAEPFLENLRISVSEAQFRVRAKNRPKKAPKKKRRVKSPKSVSVTISIGAAEPGRSLSKAEAVIKKADKALYRAKKKGRNCTVIT